MKPFDIGLDDLMDAFDLESLDGFGDLMDDDETETRIIAPRLRKPITAAYRHAEEFAKAVSLEKDAHYYAIVSGDFIFGDLLEALICDKETHVKNLDVATLSLSQNNIDSFRTIMDTGYCLKLNLIVSHYFFSHERKGLIPYIYQELDRGDRFQLSVAGSHCKIACFETFEGLKFSLHGSANLRSSSNVEQFTLTEDAGLYDFNMQFMDGIHRVYSTIKHGEQKGIAGRGKLWQQVHRPDAKTV